MPTFAFAITTTVNMMFCHPISSSPASTDLSWQMIRCHHRQKHDGYHRKLRDRIISILTEEEGIKRLSLRIRLRKSSEVLIEEMKVHCTNISSENCVVYVPRESFSICAYFGKHILPFSRMADIMFAMGGVTTSQK